MSETMKPGRGSQLFMIGFEAPVGSHVEDVDAAPGRALAAAVIRRAVIDLRMVASWRDRAERPACAHKRLREIGPEADLVAWLSSPEESRPCSLGWWCQYIDADPVVLTEQLRQQGLLERIV